MKSGGLDLVTTSDPLTISVASFADLPAIVPAWWRLLADQQNLDYRGSPTELRTPTNTDRVERFLESKIRQGRLIIARFESELAGICTVSPDGFILDAPAKIWEIADVWVEPHFRRRGIATALVKHCERECSMRGVDEVRLSVYAINDSALALYQSLGYDVSSYTLAKRFNPTG